MSNIRLPEMAGKFYPADPNAALTMLQACLNSTIETGINNPKMLVLPHAGWNYCLPVMASGLRTLLAAKAKIKRVVLIGPAHRLQFTGIATPSQGVWKTLFGDVKIDTTQMNSLVKAKKIVVNNQAFTNEHSLEVILPALQKIIGEFQLLPLLVGEVEEAQVEEVLREIWGGAETLIVVSSDLSHFNSSQEALNKDTQTRVDIESYGQSRITAQEACGYRALNAALKIAETQDLRLTALDVRHSGHFTQDQSRVVGYGAFVAEPAATARLNENDRKHLVNTAMLALEKAVELQTMPEFSLDPALKPTFAALRASFISLKMNGQLRGCIGSLYPYRSLLLDVASNAVKAALSDERFASLTKEELATCDVEISILSHPRALTFASQEEALSQMRVGHEGYILREGENVGLFLPSVWEGLPSPQAFLNGLKRKAGLKEAYWSDTLKIFRFTTESFGSACRQGVEFKKPELKKAA
jgi:MEMO1 family protein